jgi:hypothetical protein
MSLSPWTSAALASSAVPTSQFRQKSCRDRCRSIALTAKMQLNRKVVQA